MDSLLLQSCSETAGIACQLSQQPDGVSLLRFPAHEHLSDKSVARGCHHHLHRIRINRYMNFSIAELLANFKDDKTLTLKTLQKKLHCSDDASTKDLQIVVDALERTGVLEKERGKYRRLPQEGVVEGKLRCSSKGFCFAIQDDEAADDVYVRESQLNSAWNGDRVLVKVTKEGSRRRSPEGEVKLILERANASVLARVKEEAGAYQAVPLDDRLLFELALARAKRTPSSKRLINWPTSKSSAIPSAKNRPRVRLPRSWEVMRKPPPIATLSTASMICPGSFLRRF
jgi:hypothetical protein